MMSNSNDSHLNGLSEIQKRLVRAYATSILGNTRTIDDVVQKELVKYVLLDISEREINVLGGLK